jgi:hypothetical protein
MPRITQQGSSHYNNAGLDAGDWTVQNPEIAQDNFQGHNLHL